MALPDSDPATWPARAREHTLRRLTEAQARVLGAAPMLDAGAALALYRALLPLDAGGVGGPAGRQPDGYWFKRVARPARARGYLESRAFRGDDRASTLLAYGYFAEPEGPPPGPVRAALLGFRVSWELGRSLLPAFFARRSFPLALTSDDGAYGVAVTAHVGYLPWELDDGETIYNVARWRPVAG